MQMQASTQSAFIRHAGFAADELSCVGASQFMGSFVDSAREARMNGICASRPKPIDFKIDRLCMEASLVLIQYLFLITFGQQDIIIAERICPDSTRSTPSRRGNCSFQAKDMPETEE